LTTYVRDFGHEVEVRENPRPKPGVSLAQAARSAPGVPITAHNCSGERLNSNRGHIDGEILIRYDKNFIVYDPDLVQSEIVRIKKMKAKRKTGSTNKWAKGNFTWSVIRPIQQDLRDLLNHYLKKDAGLRVNVTKPDKHVHTDKEDWMALIDSHLTLLLTLRTRAHLDLETSPIHEAWKRVVTQLTEIGKVFSYSGDCPGLKALQSAINQAQALD
jgi:hypothetical protein